MADGTITFSTALDNKQLERDFAKAKKQIESAASSLSSSKGKLTAIEAEMDRYRKQAEAASAATEELRARMESLKATDPANQEAWHAARAEAEGLAAQLERAEARETEIAEHAWKLDQRWKAATADVAKHEAELERAKGRASELGDEVKRSAKNAEPAWKRASESMKNGLAGVAEAARQRMAEAAQRSVDPWQRFASRVGSLMRRVLVFSIIARGLNQLRQAVGEMLSRNKQFTASVQNLKAVAGGFLSQMVSAVLPALTAVVNTLAAGLQRLAALFDSVFGTDIARRIMEERERSVAGVRSDNAEKRAKYEQQVAKAEEREAKAADKLAKKQERANKQLLAFDELNQLAAEDAEDMEDSFDDFADAIEEPDYDEEWTQNLVPDAGVMQGVLDWLSELGRRIATDVEGPFARIREGLQRIRDGWGELLEGFRTGDLGLIWKGITDIVIGACYVIEGAFAALMDWLDEATGGRFTDIFQGLSAIVSGFVMVIEGLLTGDIPLAFDGLVQILDGVTQVAHGIVSAICDAVRAGVTWLFDYLAEQSPEFAGFFQSTKEMILGIIDGIEGALHKALDGSREAIQGALDIIVGICTLDGERIRKGVEEVASGIRTIIDGIASGARTILESLFSWVRDGVNGVFDALAAKFPQAAGLFEGLKRTVLGVFDVLEGAALGIIDGVGTALSRFVDGAKQIIQGAMDVIAGIFTLNGELIVGGLKGIVNGFITVVEGLLDGVITGVVGFVNGIADGLSNIPGVDLPSITFTSVSLPRLATGAVIPPNREFAAVLGDQRHGNNIETPEALMRQVVREESGAMVVEAVRALMESGRGTGQGRDVVLMVGTTELARATVQGIRNMQESRELGDALSLGFA